MAFKIVLTDLFSFKVAGTTNDEKGIAQPFEFVLKADRLDEEEIQTELDEGGTVMQFLVKHVKAWTGVTDEKNEPVAFSQDALKSLGKISGLPRLMLRAYMAGVGAKEKN